MPVKKNSTHTVMLKRSPKIFHLIAIYIASMSGKVFLFRKKKKLRTV